MSFRAITVAAAYLVMAASPVRADISDSERTAIPAAGINEVMMRDISFTDLEYNGSEGRNIVRYHLRTHRGNR